ncbi:MAG: hypothetical protein K5777_04290 [Nitrosopumilus sp.]|nr:hypothetical protein [Nitrosopumilus sp.]
MKKNQKTTLMIIGIIIFITTSLLILYFLNPPWHDYTSSCMDLFPHAESEEECLKFLQDGLDS